MNKIRFQDLKNDYDFLERLNFEQKVWKESPAKLTGKPYPNINNNSRRFAKHPKRLGSDVVEETLPPNSKDSELKLHEEMLTKAVTLEYLKTIVPNVDSMEDPTLLLRSIPRSPIVNDNILLNKLKLPQPNVPQGTSKPSENHSKVPPANPPPMLSDYDFDRKVHLNVERSKKLLSEIRGVFETGISSIRDEDYQRQKKRTQEFSNRFSRIYLYPLQQTTNELSMPATKPNQSAINQKLLHCHQLVIQGLQAYHNQLPTSVDDYAGDKFKLLLDQIVFLCELYFLLKKPDDYSSNSEDGFINGLRLEVEKTEAAMDEFVTYEKAKQERDKALAKNKVGNTAKPKKKLSRFSMYASSTNFRRDAPFQKAFAALTAPKPNVKSKYKTAMFKHRPRQTLSQTAAAAPPPLQGYQPAQLKSRTSINNVQPIQKKQQPVVNEDNIETMVQTKPDNECLTHEDVSDKILRLVRTSCDNGVCNVDEKELTTALETLKKCLGDDEKVLKKVAKKIAKRNINCQLEFVEKKEEPQAVVVVEDKRKEPIITSITGEKNAKLICMRNIDMVIEENEDEEVNEDPHLPSPRVHLTNSETQTEIPIAENNNNNNNNRPIINTKTNNNKASVKVSKLPKVERVVLKTLPKESLMNIIQYKLDFYKYNKGNPLYKKSAKPWEMWASVSDQVLEELLLSITREMEISDIVNNIYQEEFQL